MAFRGRGGRAGGPPPEQVRGREAEEPEGRRPSGGRAAGPPPEQVRGLEEPEGRRVRGAVRVQGALAGPRRRGGRGAPGSRAGGAARPLDAALRGPRPAQALHPRGPPGRRPGPAEPAEVYIYIYIYILLLLLYYYYCYYYQ